MTLYLDSNATTPIDPRVLEEMLQIYRSGPLNAGSPHRYGRAAKHLVHAARDRIGAVVGARRHEIVFTSGATESNNLAILGLAELGKTTQRRHIVSSQIEHKAVLEPLAAMARQGFDVTLVPPDNQGRVAADAILNAVRPDTLLISLMQVNNETGVRQPVAEIASQLPERGPYFHVDAAQGYGKDLDGLTHARIDLISVSGHKIHGPQGIGALVVRRRGGEIPPLTPLLHGGGQELGLRPGTLPVPLIAGFGLAAELAAQEALQRAEYCKNLQQILRNGFAPLGPVYHGQPEWALPHVVNLSIPGMDAEELLESLDGLAAVSDGAACTTVCATASHVLAAMGLRPPVIDGAVRFSWSYLTPQHEFTAAVNGIQSHLLPRIHLSA